MAVADGRKAGQEAFIEEEIESNILRLGKREHRRREVGITEGTETGEDPWLPENVGMRTELRVIDELRQLLAEEWIILFEQEVQGGPGLVRYTKFCCIFTVFSCGRTIFPRRMAVVW